MWKLRKFRKIQEISEKFIGTYSNNFLVPKRFFGAAMGPKKCEIGVIVLHISITGRLLLL